MTNPTKEVEREIRARVWLETSQRRYRELVEGKVKGVPGPLVLQRLRARCEDFAERRKL